MNTRLALIGLISLIPFAAAASNDEIVGTYNLVSGTRNSIPGRLLTPTEESTPKA
jgi:hypothetical protein